MPTEQTRSIITAVYAAAARGDTGAVALLLADDVVLIQAAGLPYGGCWQGLSAVGAALKRMYLMMGKARLDRPGLEVHAIIADGDRGVGLIMSRGVDRRGENYEMPVTETFQVREGKITLIQPYYYDTANMPLLEILP